MKAAAITLATALCLAGCHANRSNETSPAGPSPSTSSATAKADKALEKSRDAMLGKNTDIESQHWATDPAAASTAATPAVAPGATTPASTSSPAAASPTAKTDGGH